MENPELVAPYIITFSILYLFYLLCVFIVYYSGGFKTKLSFILSLIPLAGAVGIIFLMFIETFKNIIGWHPVESTRQKVDKFMDIYRRLK